MGFKRKTKTSQEIPTSALPDIIFILLFFFMVTTKMRKENLLVENNRPQVTQLQKLEQKNTTSFIYIGKPKKTEVYGTEPRVQVNDAFVSPNEIPQFIQQEKTKLGPKAAKLKVVLKIDKEAKMGLITDVKMRLREADARRIVYSANKLTEVY